MALRVDSESSSHQETTTVWDRYCDSLFPAGPASGKGRDPRTLQFDGFLDVLPFVPDEEIREFLKTIDGLRIRNLALLPGGPRPASEPPAEMEGLQGRSGAAEESKVGLMQLRTLTADSLPIMSASDLLCDWPICPYSSDPVCNAASLCRWLSHPRNDSSHFSATVVTSVPGSLVLQLQNHFRSPQCNSMVKNIALEVLDFGELCNSGLALASTVSRISQQLHSLRSRSLNSVPLVVALTGLFDATTTCSTADAAVAGPTSVAVSLLLNLLAAIRAEALRSRVAPIKLVIVDRPVLCWRVTLSSHLSSLGIGPHFDFDFEGISDVFGSAAWTEEEVSDVAQRISMTAEKLVDLQMALAVDDDEDDTVGLPQPLVVVNCETEEQGKALLSAVLQLYVAIPLQVSLFSTKSPTIPETSRDGSQPLFLIWSAQDVATERQLNALLLEELANVHPHGVELKAVVDFAQAAGEFEVKERVLRLQDTLGMRSLTKYPEQGLGETEEVEGRQPSQQSTVSLTTFLTSQQVDAGGRPRFGRIDTEEESLASHSCIQGSPQNADCTAAALLLVLAGSTGSPVWEVDPRVLFSVHQNLQQLVGRSMALLEMMSLVEPTAAVTGTDTTSSGLIRLAPSPIGSLVASAVSAGFSIPEARLVLTARCFALHREATLLLSYSRLHSDYQQDAQSTNQQQVYDILLRAGQGCGLHPQKLAVTFEGAKALVAATSVFIEVPDPGLPEATPRIVLQSPLLRFCAVFSAYPFVSFGRSDSVFGGLDFGAPVSRRDLILACRRGVRTSFEKLAAPSVQCRGWWPAAPVTLVATAKLQVRHANEDAARIANDNAESAARTAGTKTQRPNALISSEGPRRITSATEQEVTKSLTTLLSEPRSFVSGNDLCHIIVEHRQQATSQPKRGLKTGKNGAHDGTGETDLVSGIGVIFTLPLYITEPLIRLRVTFVTFMSNMALFVRQGILTDVGCLPPAFAEDPTLRALLTPATSLTAENHTSTEPPFAAMSASGALLDRRFPSLPALASSGLVPVTDKMTDFNSLLVSTASGEATAKRAKMDAVTSQLAANAGSVQDSIETPPDEKTMALIKQAAQTIVKLGSRSNEEKLKGNKLFGFLDQTHRYHGIYLKELGLLGMRI